MWVQIGNDYLNLDNPTAVRQGRAEKGDPTATTQTTAERARRYTGDDALTFREALQAVCVLPAAEETWTR
jgi:hypothetical protein